MKKHHHIVDEEVKFGKEMELVSTTDTRGVITYANDAFCQVAGYERDEMIGKNHNMVRHPDMPKEAFKDLWEHLKQRTAWRGQLKIVVKMAAITGSTPLSRLFMNMSNQLVINQ